MTKTIHVDDDIHAYIISTGKATDRVSDLVRRIVDYYKKHQQGTGKK